MFLWKCHDVAIVIPWKQTNENSMIFVIYWMPWYCCEIVKTVKKKGPILSDSVLSCGVCLSKHWDNFLNFGCGRASDEMKGLAQFSYYQHRYEHWRPPYIYTVYIYSSKAELWYNQSTFGVHVSHMTFTLHSCAHFCTCACPIARGP